MTKLVDPSYRQLKRMNWPCRGSVWQLHGKIQEVIFVSEKGKKEVHLILTENGNFCCIFSLSNFLSED